MKKKKMPPEKSPSVRKERPHLVIMGAGFGGMYAYKALSRRVHKTYKITIINKTNHFLFTPLLHEVATGSLQTYQVVEPIRSLISPETCFLQTEVTSLDAQKKVISTKHGEVSYDMLISALGAKTCYFNIPGAAEYSLVLKTLADAVHLKKRFIQKFEAASCEKDSLKRKQLLSFVVVGSGPTGVELVGEAADLFFDTFGKYYQNIYSSNEVSLILISTGEHILKNYKLRLRTHAQRKLLQHQVIIKKNTRIAHVLPDRVITAQGEEIRTETVIWTAGVTPQNLLCEQDIFHKEHHKIVVDEYMFAENTDNVYVVGDMSFVQTADKKGYPMTAQVARQQGTLVGKNISRILAGKQAKKFIYKEKGMLASLGNYSAVADIFGIPVVGIVAWFLWRSIYIGNFISWRKRFRIMFDWTINLFTERDITHL